MYVFMYVYIYIYIYTYCGAHVTSAARTVLCRSVLQRVAIKNLKRALADANVTSAACTVPRAPLSSVLALCYSVLQLAAVCCSVLQCVAKKVAYRCTCGRKRDICCL